MSPDGMNTRKSPCFDKLNFDVQFLVLYRLTLHAAMLCSGILLLSLRLAFIPIPQSCSN